MNSQQNNYSALTEYEQMVLEDAAMVRVIESCGEDEKMREMTICTILQVLNPSTRGNFDLRNFAEQVDKCAVSNPEHYSYMKALFVNYADRMHYIQITPEERSYAMKLNTCLYHLYQISECSPEVEETIETIKSNLQEMLISPNQWKEYLDLRIYNIKTRLDTLGIVVPEVDMYYESLYEHN